MDAGSAVPSRSPSRPRASRSPRDAALFGEALIDEGAGRYRTALDKFARVMATRDTAPVEYRTATCVEGLGQLPAAYDAYGSAVCLGASEPSMTDVVQAARTRRDALSKRVARLTLVPPDSATAFSVQVDDATYPRETLGQPIVLDAGRHTVVATAFGQGPFRSQVSIPEGGVASLPIVFAQTGADSPGPSPSSSPASPGEAPAPAAGNNRTLGWILTGAGGALLVGSGVLLFLRHQDISTLDSACPGGACPPTAEPERPRLDARPRARRGPRRRRPGRGRCGRGGGRRILLRDLGQLATRRFALRYPEHVRDRPGDRRDVPVTSTWRIEGSRRRSVRGRRCSSCSSGCEAVPFRSPSRATTPPRRRATRPDSARAGPPERYVLRHREHGALLRPLLLRSRTAPPAARCAAPARTAAPRT